MWTFRLHTLVGLMEVAWVYIVLVLLIFSKSKDFRWSFSENNKRWLHVHLTADLFGNGQTLCYEGTILSHKFQKVHWWTLTLQTIGVSFSSYFFICFFLLLRRQHTSVSGSASRSAEGCPVQLFGNGWFRASDLQFETLWGRPLDDFLVGNQNQVKLRGERSTVCYGWIRSTRRQDSVCRSASKWLSLTSQMLRKLDGINYTWVNGPVVYFCCCFTSYLLEHHLVSCKQTFFVE